MTLDEQGGNLALVVVGLFSMASLVFAGNHLDIPHSQLTREPQRFSAKADESGTFTWRIPPGSDAFILPLAGGVLVETSNVQLMRWLRQGSPWDISELPLIGVRYGQRTAVVIMPWPHYATLVVADQMGVRFSFPPGRNNSTPCDIVALWQGNNPLEVAQAFRKWRESGAETGAIPRPRPLRRKAMELPAVAGLFGAPHIYLWGPALFSRHDVDRDKWIPLARTLRDSPLDTFAGRLKARFSPGQRKSLDDLAKAEWPEKHLTLDLAAAIDTALPGLAMLNLPRDTAPDEIVRRNSQALARAVDGMVHPPASWGDGFSRPMLEELRAAGVNRALLLLSDLYGRSPRPDLAARARELGFLIGPYDSYHSIHDPGAPPDATWETAQFGKAAFESGRVMNLDGSGHQGFKGRGFHFSPIAALPYCINRVTNLLTQTPFSAWFVDCDATAECFDDYSPGHPASRVDDINARRKRLRWLGGDKKLVVGSEGGSVLFADVIHFGHGIQTPYLGHLAPEFKDPQSPHFLGYFWPSDTPANSFKSIPVPPGLMTPYFDPRVRLPLYQAALGDEIVVSHHWSFDSMKLGNVSALRELMELLYMVPPMYHLNRETWPERREQIVRHFAYWSPLHRELATAQLIRFDWLTPDRLLQRTTFRSSQGEVTMTVNFSTAEAKGYPPESATVAGEITVPKKAYRAAGH